MAKSSKALRGRMRTIQNTRKITRTMELVSTSKLKRAQDRVVAARPYAAALAEVIAELVTPELVERFPLLKRPAPPENGGPVRAAVLLITSNRGLCGGFNSNLIKEALRRIATLEAKGYQVDLHLAGRKGIGYFKYNRPRPSPVSDRHRRQAHRPARCRAGRGPDCRILAGQARQRGRGLRPVISPISTPPITLGVLPVAAPAASKGGVQADYILEARCRRDPGAAAPPVRPQPGVSRVGGDGGGGARGTADGP